MMSAETHIPRASRISRRTVVLTLIGAPIAVVVGYLVYAQQSASARLQRAIEAADRQDANWRLGDVEAHRAMVPDAENSAFRVRSVSMKLKGWLDPPPGQMTTPMGGPLRGAELFRVLGTIPTEEALAPELAAGLKAELAARKAEVDEARPLSEMGEGRFPIAYAPVFNSTLLPQTQGSRDVARLLQLDAMARAQDGDIDGALDSCRAILGVARSIGDEPFLISQLVRIAEVSVALATIDRVLAQGVASDAALARVQEALAKEAKTNYMLNGLRGERAGTFDMFAKFRSGEISAAQLAGGPTPMAVGVLARTGSFSTNASAAMLEWFNRAVAIGRMPLRDQGRLWKEWDVDAGRQGGIMDLSGTIVRMTMPAVRACAEAELRAHAQLAVGMVLIASERRRLAAGRWPDRVEDLKPAFFADVPEDPYSPDPVKLARRDDGPTVYVVGPDRFDNKGVLDPRGRPVNGADLGYRLFDVGRRRRSPAELPADVFARDAP